MKQCTYCGKEYPDDAEACAIDGHLLQHFEEAPNTVAVKKPTAKELKAAQAARRRKIGCLVLGFVLLPICVMGLLGWIGSIQSDHFQANLGYDHYGMPVDSSKRVMISAALLIGDLLFIWGVLSDRIK